MSDLDTIVIDLIQSRMRAGDTVTIAYDNDPPPHWLLSEVSVRNAVPSSVRTSSALRKGQSFKAPCAVFSYSTDTAPMEFCVPMLLVPAAVTIEKVGPRMFRVRINRRIRTAPDV
jgi:hypothetical protein